MSFSLTEPQLLAGEKDVTRRLGWLDLREGDSIVALRKGMGLRKGERQVVLGTIRVVRVSRERLNTISADEVRREGFPQETPESFVAFFCRANKCDPSAFVTRIEFQFTKGPDTRHGS
jgi:hypothetical protein